MASAAAAKSGKFMKSSSRSPGVVINSNQNGYLAHRRDAGQLNFFSFKSKVDSKILREKERQNPFLQTHKTVWQLFKRRSTRPEHCGVYSADSTGLRILNRKTFCAVGEEQPKFLEL